MKVQMEADADEKRKEKEEFHAGFHNSLNLVRSVHTTIDIIFVLRTLRLMLKDRL